VICGLASSYLIWEAPAARRAPVAHRSDDGEYLAGHDDRHHPGLVGDAFGRIFRGNMKNMALLRRHMETRGLGHATGPLSRVRSFASARAANQARPVALSLGSSQEKVMTQQGSGYPAQPPKPTGEKGGERLRERADTATDQLKGAADRAQELAGDVSRQAREYGEKAQDAARQVRPFVERSLKDQPMTTLAAVAAIGFVLGALWKK
jgi:ElaB/YqjD/DUF883 family membrane-anchored ribosome-binding protein